MNHRKVLGEFYRAVTSPRRVSALKHEEAVARIQIWKSYQICQRTVSHVDLALKVVAHYKIGYYDALILAAASFADCPVLYSEDLGSGQVYKNVKVVNPFSH